MFLPIRYTYADNSALDPNSSSFSYTSAVSNKNDISQVNTNNITENGAEPSVSNLVATTGGAVDEENLSDQVSVYTVHDGDTYSAIAGMFGVSVNTILWANDKKKSDKPIVGETLIILPIDGINYTVKSGDTLKNIADKNGADVADMLAVNDGLTIDTELTVGQEIIIPGAEVDAPADNKPKSNTVASTKNNQNYYKDHPIQNTNGYFIDPVPTGHRTQNLHGPGNRGIDIGASIGTPIYAAASGTVLIAKTGWSGGYGNMIILQHPNGTKTLYGHMSRLGTHTGDKVSQGEIIGYVGSTGHSTGPHVHFEVFNAKNPGSDWSWKR